MKLYNTKTGIVIEQNEQFYQYPGNWEQTINDDNIYQKLLSVLPSLKKTDAKSIELLLPCIGAAQELWACGVTYHRSMVGRQEESAAAGGSDFYAKVYEAERPECFFKSTPHRVVGHGAQVRIRKDSQWDVPEPELTLVVTSSGKIIGYTVGNDMSSRSIEGENPLYLPQAKTYDGCAAVGPCVFLTDQPFPADANIELLITRNNRMVFEGSVSVSRIKRSLQELVSFVYRECSFPNGCLIMTGTGIVPGNDFTLKSGDSISIRIDNIGTLVNSVQ
ncbi:MAG: fumarylacetoacetate hydrolase family protein [Bacteroidota bacterium]|nr:fumarylacetoacetate hydrolase family protein [Bacteroidota bacterium]